MKKMPLKAVRSKLKTLFTKKRVIFGAAILLIFLILTPLITYAYFARDIENKDRLMNRNSTGIILKDKNGEIFYEYGVLGSEDDVKLNQVSDNLEKALLASEDRDFYKHEGYSLRGIAGALYSNLLSKDATRYGGSTITQQLVKNKLFTSDKNYLRKYQEISMAVAVDRKYSKQEVLEMYLNSVYFGEGAFGIADASKTYFNKTTQDLNIAESAMLVGLLPAPSAYNPISGDPEAAKKQQQRVLNDMLEAGYVTEEVKNDAANQELVFAPGRSKNYSNAQHYTLMVLDELKKKYGEERIIRSGFEVTTGLDLKWQKQAEANVKKRVQIFQKAGGRNSGLVAIDPKSGQVRALVGSVDWSNETFGKVNMAFSERQPGSSFKPIYYSEALDKRIITPVTILEDAPKTYGDTYKPENYDFKYRGKITVRNALAQSLNIPAVDVMQKLGVEEASTASQQMGITTVNQPEKYGLSLALGTAEVKLYELTNAYAALANEGKQYKPILFTSIKDKFNNKIYEHQEQTARQVRSPEAAFLISSILSDNAARAPTFRSTLNIPNRQVAVKTGTTNDNKDAWTLGYTPSVAVGVWVGNNENEPMRGLAGGSSAGLIWRDTISIYLNDLPKETFNPPPNVIQVNVCKSNGLRAVSDSRDAYGEYFIKGTEPTQPCVKVEEKKQEEKKEERKEEKDEEEKPGNGNEKKKRDNEEGGRGGEEKKIEAPLPPSEEEEEETTTNPPATSPTPTTSPTQ